MWYINDEVLSLPEHSIMWADEYGRIIERKRERHKMKLILKKIELLELDDKYSVYGELTER